MPNWCHDTLIVAGPPQELERFIEAARPQDEALRRDYADWPSYDMASRPATWHEYARQAKEHQPLSFGSLVPEPSQATYEAMEDEMATMCNLCQGKGKRPVTKEEADEWGAPFYEDVVPVMPFEDREPCNGCGGKGRRSLHPGWYEWRIQNWGTKWDASFSEPFGALGAEEANPELSVQALGLTESDQVAIYKFDTAWSPPMPVIEQASEQFPELRFTLRFAEVGNGYAGEVTYQVGIEQDSKELEVEEVLAPEEMWF